MIQHNQIGKYRRKEDVLNAKRGKTFVTPNGEEYQLDYEKRGNKYIIIFIHRGIRMQVKEAEFNKTPIRHLILAIESVIESNELKTTEHGE